MGKGGNLGVCNLGMCPGACSASLRLRSLITLPVLFKVTLEVRFQGVRKTNTNWDGTGLYVLYVVLVLEEDAEECQYLH